MLSIRVCLYEFNKRSCTLNNFDIFGKKSLLWSFSLKYKMFTMSTLQISNQNSGQCFSMVCIQ